MMKYLLIIILMLGSWVSAQETQPQTGTETGNIIYTTLNPPPQGAPFSWTGFVNENTGGGGLTGGFMPAYNSITGTFIFGFAPGTIQYATAVNFALQNAGTGIKVNGFRYSWEYFNQDFSRGTLSTNIRLTDNAGKIVENYNYLLPQTTEGWTRMSGVENFSSLYSPSSLGNLELTLTGKDDRFWAGYYGPQIRDIDVRLLYGTPPPPAPTIPTTTNVTTSDIIAEVTAPATTTEPTTTQTVAQTTPVVETNTVTTTTPSTFTSTVTIQPVVAAVQTTRESAPSSQATPQQQSVQQSSSSPSLSSVLSMIQNNQARENAIAQTAISQANQAAQQAVAQTEQTALSVAATSSSQSIDIAKDSVKAETKDTKTNSNNGIPLIAAGTSSVNLTVNQSQSNNTINPTQTTQTSIVNPLQQNTINMSNMSVSQATSLPAGAQNLIIKPDSAPIQTSAQPVVETITQSQLLPPTNPLISNAIETPNSNNAFFTNKADPLQDYVEKNSIMVAMAQSEVRPTTVRTNVQDNEAAGNVKVERLQVVPNGYNQYLNLTLRDTPFYPSKEIYKNQKVIDNARALRQLATDRLHQEMVEQQYRR